MRRVALVLGLVLLALIWSGPLPRLALGSFSAHMIMHMGVVAVAAPLLALGLAQTRFDATRSLPALFAPLPASLFELVVVWSWHAPSLHHAARQSSTVLVFEQGSFLLCGLVLWLAALGGESRPNEPRSGAGVVALLVTSMHMTLLGALLGLASRPLYSHAEGSGGLTALQDQHLGGAIMLLVGGASYLVGALALTTRLLRQRQVAEGA